MSPGKRIFLNVAATYGRSLYALVVGLFCARWVLMSLGEVDFGLFGVIGGLISICAVFNALLTSATTRFFAVAIGEASKQNREDGVENCRGWFNVAVLAHGVLAIVLVAVGYPIGVWSIENWLTIPAEKIGDCIWVFRFSCLTTFVSMINVPFSGMFVAKQEIAEQSLYSSFQTTFGFLIAGYMILHPGDWLVGYAALLSANTMLPELVICIRACMKYRECRLSFRQMRDGSRLWQMVRFAFYQSFTGIGFICCNQGMNILVNKVFGPVLNASMGVATKVQTHASALTFALGNAFQPAIATAWGSGDFGGMKRLAFKATKFGLFCVLVFAVPLLVGMDWVLQLWLGTPPPHASLICRSLLFALVVDKFGLGQDMALNASGKIGVYQLSQGICWMASLPIAAFFAFGGYGILSVGLGIVAGYVLTLLVRVTFAHIILGFSAVEFLMCQVTRIGVAAIGSLVSGWALLQLGQTTVLVIVAMGMSTAVIALAFWFLVLDEEERLYAQSRIKCIIGGLNHAR